MSSSLINRLSVFALLAITSFVWAQPSSKLQSIKEEGLALYNMHFDAEAVPLLELAAQAGDPEAQYYMGEIQRQKTMFMSLVAQRWYEKSADQGDIYAMLRLATADNTVCKLSENCASFVKTPEQWGNLARNLGRQGAAQGDGEAMFQLYLLTSDFGWLIKSAEAGFPEGQNLLGLYYQEGKGIFLIPGKREKEI
ncbi:tetratricopeptide repeat protein [Pseudomonas syringae]|uniref:tetratricopeptide repeat protein n=1 Tax=Pseudomonas syringae TaxID=317 RepID=UPI001112C6BA|nr:sel1 repeat family protein [Pseudomonas syringae]